MTTLFISDLHLEESRPDITDACLRFLAERATGQERLYILGDFFEAWIGDDERTPLQEQVAAALKAVRASGTELFLMHGNRDFLIGEAFCDRAGAVLLDDPTVVDLYGTWLPGEMFDGALDGFRLDAGVDNLLDKNYQRHLSNLPEEGVNYKMAVRYMASF